MVSPPAITYDVMRRISRILTSRSNCSSLLDLSYGYDKVGNILSINSETYGYDALNRLASSSGPWGSTSYTYDQVGNRLTKTEGGTTVTYTYGSYNRLTSSNNPQTSYTYDNDGNMLGRSGGGTTWNYTFAWSDHLTQVKKNSSVVAQYYYDGDGGRVKTVEGSVTTLYGAGFEKITANNTLVKLISGNGMIARIINDTVRYYHANHIGSTRLVTNSSGGVVFNSNYKPFGAQVNQTGTDPFKFQGKHEDSPTGLYYFGDNYYDPDLGRYISNSYVFAGNNPLGGSTISIAMNIDMSTGIDRTFIQNQWKQYALPSPPAPVPITQAAAMPPAIPSTVFDLALEPTPASAPIPTSSANTVISTNTGSLSSDTISAATTSASSWQPKTAAYGSSSKQWFLEDYAKWAKGYVDQVKQALYVTDANWLDYDPTIFDWWDNAPWDYPAKAAGFIIYLNPNYFAGSTDPDLGVLIHEMAHVYLKIYWHWNHDDGNTGLDEGVVDYVRANVFPSSPGTGYRGYYEWVSGKIKQAEYDGDTNFFRTLLAAESWSSTYSDWTLKNMFGTSPIY